MTIKRLLCPVFFTLLLVLFGNQLTSEAAYGSDITEEQVRTMSFNLRYANANDEYSWESRRPIVKELIEKEQPDIIGTQEGVYRQIMDIEEDLPAYARIGVGREGGIFGEFMAVYYKKNRFAPIEWNHVWLSDKPNVVSSYSWGNKIPRMVTWVKFMDLKTNKPFYFVNTHLDHQSEKSRQKSAEFIIKSIKNFDSDLPIILTGDFNSSRNSDIYNRFIRGGFEDGFMNAEEQINKDIGTFHDYGKRTEKGDKNIIDWVLFQGNVSTLRAETVIYTNEDVYPSDHYPVMVDFILNHIETGKDPENKDSVFYKEAHAELFISELVPLSTEKGNYNFVEIYNNGYTPIDLNGYKIAYFYDPTQPFMKGRWNVWEIVKDDLYSTTTVIEPLETKVVWIKKQPCCYKLSFEQFMNNYKLDQKMLNPDQLVAVFTPQVNQGLNGSSIDGRSLALMTPDNIMISALTYNDGQIEAEENRSIVYSAPEPFSILVEKEAQNQNPSPGQHSRDLDFDTVSEMVERYIEINKISGPLCSKLMNTLRQAEHHYQREHTRQAEKFLEKFLIQLNQGEQKHKVSPEAKKTIKKAIEKLQLEISTV
ncbi:hypothetical protein J8TS2_27900 [Lederbergia ruris]|uniref:LTD domain-containing protein n=1 Tax=Lederbergia ruris TaxID=217495 RepID=A0ABQ4KLU4_9BACI|nr:endonuclease/exonuclease/phosphatase family protein [Lederbergia ruris]GIN58471.1 hypothetical protein J8TS2_27900 [Lederbergia ruris]